MATNSCVKDWGMVAPDKAMIVVPLAGLGQGMLN